MKSKSFSLLTAAIIFFGLAVLIFVVGVYGAMHAEPQNRDIEEYAVLLSVIAVFLVSFSFAIASVAIYLRGKSRFADSVFLGLNGKNQD